MDNTLHHVVNNCCKNKKIRTNRAMQIFHDTICNPKNTSRTPFGPSCFDNKPTRCTNDTKQNFSEFPLKCI